MADVGPQSNSLWAEEDRCHCAETHLAYARCQDKGPTFRVFKIITKEIYKIKGTDI